MIQDKYLFRIIVLIICLSSNLSVCFLSLGHIPLPFVNWCGILLLMQSSICCIRLFLIRFNQRMIFFSHEIQLGPTGTILCPRHTNREMLGYHQSYACLGLVLVLQTMKRVKTGFKGSLCWTATKVTSVKNYVSNAKIHN